MPFKPPLLLGFKRILACGWKIASNLFIDKHLIHDYTLENGLDKQVTFVDDQETALHQLAQGRHDCALVSRVAALSLIEKNGWTNLELGKKPILAGEYGYAVAKGQKALLSQFGEGLKTLENNGEYHRIYDKWLGVYQEEPATFLTALRYSAFVIIPLLVFLLAASVWSWTLRRQVAGKTKALQESLERFRYVFEAANVGKSMTMISGELNANQAFADFLGYTLDELNSKRWRDITPAEDIDATDQVLAPLLAGEKHGARFEKRYIHKNGERLWADVSVTLRRDADGAPLYFMTTVVDITEHKRDQLRIKHLNQVLRAIRDVNQLIVRVRDRDLLIREGCRVLVGSRGYPSVLIVLTDERDRPVTWAMEGLAANSEELAGLLERGGLPPCCGHVQAAQEVLLVDDRDRVCGGCPLAETCAESQSLCAPLTHEGEMFGYLAAAAEKHVILDEQERALFVEMAGDFAFALSVMRIEAAQRESESRFQSIVENAPEPIFIQTEMRFVYLNPKALDLFRTKDASEVLGTPVMDRFHPESQ